MSIRPVPALVGAAVVLAMPSAAVAQPSSQSINFTVNIPPIADALAAYHDGAVGLWTVKGSQGLMIAIDESKGAESSVRVYSRASLAYSFRWAQAGASGVDEHGGSARDSLLSAHFAVPAHALPVQVFTLAAI